VKGPHSHKLLVHERENSKFKQGENILLGEHFKGIVTLFAVERAFAFKKSRRQKFAGVL
jgi:hypothetical protein